MGLGVMLINTLSNIQTERTGRKKMTFFVVISSTLYLHNIYIAGYEFKKNTKIRMREKKNQGYPQVIGRQETERREQNRSPPLSFPPS